jgi:uncharacterized membrane protein
MKKYFLTGLATLLPLVLTLLIVSWIVGVLTKPFMGFLEPLMHQLEIQDKPLWIFSARQVLLYSSRLLVLLSLTLAILIVGFLMRWVLLHELVLIGEWILHRIPFVGSVYRASKEVITRLFHQKTTQLKQVVLVPFPHEKALAMGFITGDSALPKVDQIAGEVASDTITVLLPGAPNPLMGFLLHVPRNQVIFTQIRVEDALRFMISCGALCPSPLQSNISNAP